MTTGYLRYCAPLFLRLEKEIPNENRVYFESRKIKRSASFSLTSSNVNFKPPKIATVRLFYFNVGFYSKQLFLVFGV